jgi:carbon monoxide dehydrogenase subunit G
VIAAKPETVWEVLDNPYYTPKLYPDFLSIKVEPEGRASVGQKRTSTARAGNKLFEIKTKVAELIPSKKFVLVQREGGAFTVFKEVLELTPSGNGTQVVASFEFSISQNYFQGMNIVALESAARTNLESFLKNLKELAELKPLR